MTHVSHGDYDSNTQLRLGACFSPFTAVMTTSPTLGLGSGEGPGLFYNKLISQSSLLRSYLSLQNQHYFMHNGAPPLT